MEIYIELCVNKHSSIPSCNIILKWVQNFSTPAESVIFLFSQFKSSPYAGD
jgi:hypothetical protein